MIIPTDETIGKAAGPRSIGFWVPVKNKELTRNQIPINRKKIHPAIFAVSDFKETTSIF
jgi:hypothetical protein